MIVRVSMPGDGMSDRQAPRVIRAGALSGDTAQSTGAQRMAGVSAGTTGATRIWLGKVSNDPGHRSVAHHHGEAETAGYVLKGSAKIFYGPDFTEEIELHEGDFVFVPPFFPHIEANASDEAELVWLTARTPDNIVINLE
jgi:uncharacterized RmlC-like cupin family protein